MERLGNENFALKTRFENDRQLLHNEQESVIQDIQARLKEFTSKIEQTMSGNLENTSTVFGAISEVVTNLKNTEASKHTELHQRLLDEKASISQSQHDYNLAHSNTAKVR